MSEPFSGGTKNENKNNTLTTKWILFALKNIHFLLFVRSNFYKKTLQILNYEQSQQISINLYVGPYY